MCRAAWSAGRDLLLVVACAAAVHPALSAREAAAGRTSTVGQREAPDRGRDPERNEETAAAKAAHQAVTACPPGDRPVSSADSGAGCKTCGRPVCFGRCRFDPKSGVFALGQPYQYIPPPSGWTVIVPPIPSPPKPGAAPTPPSPWKPMFYLNDFRYLDKPNNPFHD